MKKVEKLRKVEIGIERVPIYTLFGKREIVKLSNFSYGEWLIFNANEPVYHINIFDSELNELKELLESGVMTIEKLIQKINSKDEGSYSLVQSFWGITNYKEIKYDIIQIYKFPFTALINGD